ncbi:MAG: hypothetical protein ACRELD_12100 [Longimicrobiales bacterium]
MSAVSDGFRRGELGGRHLLLLVALLIASFAPGHEQDSNPGRAEAQVAPAVAPVAPAETISLPAAPPEPAPRPKLRSADSAV